MIVVVARISENVGVNRLSAHLSRRMNVPANCLDKET